MPQREPFVGLSVSALSHGQPRRPTGNWISALPGAHLPARGTALGSGGGCPASLVPSAPRWRELARIYPPTEAFCPHPPDFPSLRGPGKGHPRGRTLGRKLLLTRGSGKVPSFPLDPDSGAPGLAAGVPGVLRGIWGVLSPVPALTQSLLPYRAALSWAAKRAAAGN